MVKKMISLIIPMYYDEKVINECYSKILEVFKNIEYYNYEIIFVNERTNENNYNLIRQIAKKDRNVKVITFDKNHGQQYAVVGGIKYSIGDYLIILDSKIEDSIEMIPSILEFLNNKNKVIYVTLKKEAEIKLFTEKEYISELTSVFDKDMNIDTGDFRIISRDLINKIIVSSKYSKLTKGFFSWNNYEKNPYEANKKERFLGKKKIYNILNIIGKLMVLCGIIKIVYIVFNKITMREITLPFWTPIAIGLIFFIGIQLICLKSIAGYLGKAYDEYNLKNIIIEKINIK